MSENGDRLIRASSADVSQQASFDSEPTHNPFFYAPKLFPTHGQNEYLRRHGFDRDKVEQPAPTPQGPGSWTVFVNLSANMLLSNVALRIDNQLQDQKLIDMTRDKPIKIIVQTTLNHDPRLNNAGIGELSPKQPMRSEPENTSVVRYEISNGEKRLLGYGSSQGISTDLTALLTADPQAMKAEHVALINEAHGLNLSGFEADSGSIDLAKFKSTVKDSLKQQGRDSLDVLDLVSCDMASVQAIHELADLTKYTIASEEEQSAYRGSADELLSPIALPISKLIQNTQMNPKEFGETIIQSNTEICTENSKLRFAKGPDALHPCAANTLGLYDEANANRLSTALDQLGTALSSVSQSDKNRAAITAITTGLPKVYGDSIYAIITSTEDDEQKDLGMLVSKLENGLDRKTITDTSGGDLRHSLNKMKSAMKDAIVTHFNSASLDMGLPNELSKKGLPGVPISGLSVFLPTPQSNLTKHYAKQEHDAFGGKLKFDQSQLDREITQKNFSIFTTSPVKNDLVEQRNKLMKYIPSVQSVKSRAEIESFLQTSSKFMTWLDSAANLRWQDREAQYLNLSFQLSDNLRALMNDTQLWQELGAAKAKEHFDITARAGTIPSQPHWNQFLEGLRQQ